MSNVVIRSLGFQSGVAAPAHLVGRTKEQALSRSIKYQKDTVEIAEDVLHQMNMDM